MQNGLYKIRYWTKESVGTGIAVLEDGCIQGGDSLTAIAGTYSADKDQLQARLRIKRHSEGLPTLFGEDKATLVLSGSWSQDTAQLAGPVLENPDITIKLALERLDL